MSHFVHCHEYNLCNKLFTRNGLLFKLFAAIQLMFGIFLPGSKEEDLGICPTSP
jgi:hypothetical protein